MTFTTFTGRFVSFTAFTSRTGTPPQVSVGRLG